MTTTTREHIAPGFTLTDAAQWDQPQMVWTLRKVTPNSNTRIAGWEQRPTPEQVRTAMEKA